MECHNSNSSLDTVLISLDCEEEIKSEYSSLDTVILNNIEESKPKKAHRHYKSRTEHRCTRHNLRKKHSESGQAFVTQKIHVEKQDFQCIINLNTTICDHHENSRHTSCDAKSSKGPKNIYKRIVPHCLRQLCHQPRLLQTRFNRRHSKEHCTVSFRIKMDFL